MNLEDKIALITSYIFAIFVMFFVGYLIITQKWVLYTFAFINLSAIFVLSFLLIKNGFSIIKEKNSLKR